MSEGTAALLKDGLVRVASVIKTQHAAIARVLEDEDLAPEHTATLLKCVHDADAQLAAAEDMLQLALEDG